MMIASPTSPHRIQAVVFSKYITTVIERLGGVNAVATSWGVAPRRIEGWMHCKQVPYLRVLLDFAEHFELDVNELLEAAGKPPIETMMNAVKANPALSLPSVLCQWRDECFSGDTQAAADAAGICRGSFSKLANGSIPLSGIETTRRVARALEMSIENVLELAGEFDTPLALKFKEATTGLPGALRSAMADAGFDPFEVASRPAAAKHFGIKLDRFTNFLNGVSVPSLVERQEIAKASRIPLISLLVGIDTAVSEAEEIIEAINKGKTRLRRGETINVVIKQMRTKAGITQHAVAEACGFDRRSVIAHWETHKWRPSPTSLVRFARVTGGSLPKLLTAAGYLAA